MTRTLKARLVRKLHPEQIRVSPLFHAILAYLLGQTGWTTPELAALSVTSDGFLLGMRKGDVGYDDFLGTHADLDRNLRGVADAVDLTPAERETLLTLAPQPATPSGG
jgi:hypothetical protein